MNTLLAVTVGGSGVIWQLVMVIVFAVCLLGVWAFGIWVARAFKASPNIEKGWTGLILFVALILGLNAILGIFGDKYQFIHW